ncbi:MAG: matrixin family metalloprotease, partial [Chthoniobacterales bacterium]
MRSRTSIFVLLTRRAATRAMLVAALAGLIGAKSADAYVLNGKTWASGTITMQLGLGNAGRTLTDGNTNWNQAVEPALGAWNQVIGRVQFWEVMDSTAALSTGDRINTVGFRNDVFGTAFGSGTLAVTYYIMSGSSMVEADVLFNPAQSFDSYRGPLHFGSNGYAIGDIRRVFLHELGHALGLNHASGDVIMNALTSDREVLASDDIAGAQAMYGAAAPTPVPTPTPTPTSTTSTLVNISTRMNVGTGDNVLIAGFIIQGTQPKKLLLRAAGPSLAQYGVANSLSDSVLELHDSTGALIQQNDNWQTGGQFSEINASGKAPTNPAEAALIATLNPGTYTAIVRGANNAQGVALVEGFELDTPATKMVNLSTRGSIGTGDNVMIAGFQVQGGSSKKVIVRALGPSLTQYGVQGALANPLLELHDSSGALVSSNDDWSSSSQKLEIIASTDAPPNPLDSAIVATLAPGSYTAIVRGVNGLTGIGLVE